MKPSRTTKLQFPKPFQSPWTDDGDASQCFTISVNHDGFEVTRCSVPIDADYLFDDLSYWPEEMVWTGSAATLDELLKQLGKHTRLTRQALLRPMFNELTEFGKLDVKGYLSDEKIAVKGGEDLSKLRRRWSALFGSHRVPGMPSPEIWFDCWETLDGGRRSPQDCCFYNGLELDFNQRGWKARLYSADDSGDEELFYPVRWHADTFDGLFSALNYPYKTEITDYLRWTREELFARLIKDDSRWKEFIKPVRAPSKLSKSP